MKNPCEESQRLGWLDLAIPITNLYLKKGKGGRWDIFTWYLEHFCCSKRSAFQCCLPKDLNLNDEQVTAIWEPPDWKLSSFRNCCWKVCCLLKKAIFNFAKPKKKRTGVSCIQVVSEFICLGDMSEIFYWGLEESQVFFGVCPSSFKSFRPAEPQKENFLVFQPLLLGS